MVVLAGASRSFDTWAYGILNSGPLASTCNASRKRNGVRPGCDVRYMSGRALQHFCNNLRCAARSLRTAHKWQSQMNSHRDMDYVREQLIKWRQTARATRTHPDIRVHLRDPNGHLPSRTRIRHLQEALLERERKKG